MRQFVIDAIYRGEIESAISRAVDLCRRDKWRRENGQTPLFADFQLSAARAGEEVTVLVDVSPELLLAAAVQRGPVSDDAQVSR